MLFQTVSVYFLWKLTGEDHRQESNTSLNKWKNKQVAVQNLENGLYGVFQSIPQLQPEAFRLFSVLIAVSLNYSLGSPQLQTFPSFTSSPKCTSTPYGKKLAWYLNWFSLLQFISSAMDLGILFYLSFSDLMYWKIVIKCFLVPFIFHSLYVKLCRCFFFFFFFFAFLYTVSSWSTLIYTAIKTSYSWGLTKVNTAEVYLMPLANCATKYPRTQLCDIVQSCSD